MLGRTIYVDAVPYTIVGVTPPDFQFWWRPSDIWVPVSLNTHDRDFRDLVVIARLKAPRDRAAAEMATIARSLVEHLSARATKAGPFAWKTSGSFCSTGHFARACCC